jgi:hypothetical protein
MSAISAIIRFYTAFNEVFTAAEIPASSNRSVNNDQFNRTIKLSASSTPAATKGWAGVFTGNQTLDFSALARTVGPTVNATGLKLQAILVNNLDATNPMTIAKGAANGYAFNGAAGNKVITPNGSWQEYFAGGLAAIDGTHKTIDITATGDFQVILIFG